MSAITPTSPSISIAPYPIGRMSLSRSIIFGVVPDAMSAWNPEIAPHAIVMNTNGKSGPGTIGPPPAVNSVKAGIWSTGLTMTTATTRNAMVPIFMNELR